MNCCTLLLVASAAPTDDRGAVGDGMASGVLGEATGLAIGVATGVAVGEASGVMAGERTGEVAGEETGGMWTSFRIGSTATLLRARRETRARLHSRR
jgi:hypothetical protein